MEAIRRGGDNLAGTNVAPAGARVLATFNDGRPALTVHRVGRGRVYYLAFHMKLSDAKRVMNVLAERCGARPDIKASSGNYTEALSFGENGHYVWYFANWGGGTSAVTASPGRISKSMPPGRYRVYDVLAREAVPAPSGNALWTMNGLKKGLRFDVPSLEPRVFVLQHELQAPVSVASVPQAQKQVLEKLWRPGPPGKHKVLISLGGWEMVSPFVDLPSALELLGRHGFQFVRCESRIGDEVTLWDELNGKKTARLSDFDIVMITNRYGLVRTPDSEAKTLRTYLEGGGSAFICGNADHNLRFHGSNWRGMNPLIDYLGIQILDEHVRQPRTNLHGFPFHATVTPKGPHDVLAAVKSIQMADCATLRLLPWSEAVPLALTADDAVRSIAPWQSNSQRKGGDLPVMAAVENGKGRVIVCGGSTWLRPDMLAEADNAQLLVNMFRWMVGDKPRPESKERLNRVLQPYVDAVRREGCWD
jgi:hypothetical protein